MEADRAYNCIVNTEEKYQGTEAEGFTANSKSHFMDFANRCSLEGSAAAVSTILDMPSAVPIMGWVRYFPTHCKRAGRRPTI
jgi:hypothetical protein